MTKKDFIALADVVKRSHNTLAEFGEGEKNALADFCQEQNPNFKRGRWLSYIAGTCGKNGGKVRTNKGE
jgi:hypothetical protein